MNTFSQFITDHPIFTFGVFLLAWLAIEQIGSGLRAFAKRTKQ